MTAPKLLFALVGLFSHNVSFLFLSQWDSLSELREYTVSLADKGKEEDKQDQGSPQASGVSGQSVISLLSPEELAKLIEEVKALDEETLKVNMLLLFFFYFFPFFFCLLCMIFIHCRVNASS